MDSSRHSHAEGEREVVQAYVDGRLPPDVEVILVPIEVSPYDGGFRAVREPWRPRLSREEEEEAKKLITAQIDIKLQQWDDIRPGLVAGFSQEARVLLVGAWRNL